MASDPDAPADLPPAWTCGSFRLGHDMHVIQWRLSQADATGVAHIVESVDHDGTIRFTDGEQRWNHDPERLRTAINRHGAEVLLASHRVLRVPHGAGAYCFSVSEEPDPSRPETAEELEAESAFDELQRREGFLRSTPSLATDPTSPQPTRSRFPGQTPRI